MGKAPAFQFYANDFMDATRFWEANAVGLYVRCLCIQWTQGFIPSDVRMLSKGVGMDFEEFEGAWAVVAPKFEDIGGGALINRRLEDVRTHKEEVSLKRSKAGKLGASAKANAKANASANGQAKHKQRKVKIEDEVEVELEVPREDKEHSIMPWPNFEDWWTLYDKKSDRPKCMEKWQRLDHGTRLQIMQHTEAYVTTGRGSNKQFRRDPIRYLNNQNWTDDALLETRTGQPTRNLSEADTLAQALAIASNRQP